MNRAAHLYHRLTGEASILALALGCALSAPVLAQESSGGGSTIIYPASYFEQWVPITAQDMLDRIPGQAGGGGGRGGPGRGGNPSSGGRGLGSGSSGTEIIINGKRTAGKNNQAGSLLSRISTEQVQEIQIIRGTSGELDVRGSGQVINVVLFETLSSNSVSWDLSGNLSQDHELKPSGSIALNGQQGDLSYLLSLRSNPRYSHSVTSERSVLGDFSRNDTVHEDRINDRENDELSMNLSYDFIPNSSVRMNAL